MLVGAPAYSSAKRRIAKQGGTVRVTNSVPENLDTLVREAMEEWQVPGLALAVTRDGEPDWVKAYGLRDVEAGLPVTVDTQFILCSVTKSFTALGLAMLVDEGRLDWAKPVRDYLPEFRLHDTVATEGVTTIDLLCHSTGLPRHDWVWMPGDISRAEMLAALRYLEPSKAIRAAYQYCNLGYVAAGMVAERISGQTWEDFTRERIMKPLGRVFGRGPERAQTRPAWAPVERLVKPSRLAFLPVASPLP
jgi:CubicO group peptidase (beta-lactamase class C family)